MQFELAIGIPQQIQCLLQKDKSTRPSKLAIWFWFGADEVRVGSHSGQQDSIWVQNHVCVRSFSIRVDFKSIDFRPKNLFLQRKITLVENIRIVFGSVHVIFDFVSTSGQLSWVSIRL